MLSAWEGVAFHFKQWGVASPDGWASAERGRAAGEISMGRAAPARPDAVPSPSLGERIAQNRGLTAALFMLPAAAFLLVFLTYPLGLGVWLGFTDTRIGRSGVFIGLENYES